MKNITLEELLEAGAHFGHQVTRQNPKARDYIFEARDNVHIIDLGKTKEGLDEAAEFVRDLAKKGGSMIILGAKRQAEPIVHEQAAKAKEAGIEGLYFVTNRWIGGILTNFHEVSKNFKKLKDLTKFMNTPSERASFTKKEISLMEKERAKLENFYWGVQDMAKLPEAVFIIDTHLEDLAVREALATRIKTVGITDTNADPTLINYPIPANDDAAGSIQLIVSHIVDAFIEGRKNASRTQEAEQKATTEKRPAADEKKAKKKSVKSEKMVSKDSLVSEAKKPDPVKTDKKKPALKKPAKKAE